MIEVEKKFILTPEQEQKLIQGAEFLGEKQFTDTYYDDADFSLTTKDLWLRKREDKFELKISKNDEMGNRISTELESDKEILDYLEASEIESVAELLTERKYQPFSEILTIRKNYEKNGFHIDLDNANGYLVAEIELMVPEGEEQKAAQKIVEFAKSLGIDTERRVLGKVAYFLQKDNPAHFEALVEAKVLRRP